MTNHERSSADTGRRRHASDRHRPTAKIDDMPRIVISRRQPPMKFAESSSADGET
jgi:hypothetical protein